MAYGSGYPGGYGDPDIPAMSATAAEASTVSSLPAATSPN